MCYNIAKERGVILIKTKSVAVLKAAIIVCAVLCVALGIAAPWIIDWYVGVRHLLPIRGTTILICYYVSMTPALVALYCMNRILQPIRSERPFEKTVLKYLGIISWCCVAVAVICACGIYWYPPMIVITGTMIFLFLTVRVVISCFLAGAKLQEENDLTV